MYNGNVVVDGSLFPEGTIGFIYKITNPATGKFYIGKKILQNRRKAILTKKEKRLPENRRKRFKQITTDSNWLEYYGSNKQIKDEVLSGVFFNREILLCVKNKTDLSYYEMYYQMKFDVLFENSYNGYIANTRFFKDKITKY